MQPEQNQPPEQQLPSSPNPKSAKRRWLWVGVVVGILAIGLIIVAMILGGRHSDNQNQTTPKQPLTVGSVPYLYPCSVATREGYARIFGLDDNQVGTVTELSALPLKDIKDGGDLSKLAPGSSSNSRLDTECSYTLAKKGASQVNRIDVRVIQLDSEKEAKDDFTSARDTASGRYSSHDQTQLSSLPSFTADDSYLKLPSDNSSSQEAGFVAGTRFVKMAYQLTKADTVEAVTPMLDAYARDIKAKMVVANPQTEPIDMTGNDTKVGAKFVDICRRTSLSQLSSTFTGIEFRPDEVTDIATYGSLSGSRAAADGAESDCMLSFNSEGDRQAIKKEDDRPRRSEFDRPMTANARWPHKMTLATNTFASTDEAKAAFETKKASAQKPVGSATTDVTDISGVGDKAYKLVRKVDLSLENAQGGTETRFTTETALVALEGKNLVVVSLQQNTTSDEYQTVPIEVRDEQLKSSLQQIVGVINANRK